MAGQKSYGQFCPVAKSAELLCKRWTMLVIRELLDGPLGFNDIRSGVLLMSRSLLSARLVELEQSGLLRHISAAPGRRAGYELTEAGYALLPVVEAMGHWGQEWIEPDLTVGDIDFGYLLWSLRRSVRRVPEMPESFLVRLHFTDAPDGHDLHWLSYRGPDIDICHSDPGGEVDVWIECEVVAFTEIWMGWRSFSSSLRDQRLVIDGPRQFTQDPFRWLGRSRLAAIGKRPRAERVKPV
ncbi:winged helix-turn-helix transcriptional regulator [Maritimibacter alkaliphilus]|uniref:winged helix-turn-helix transcriptional regulator n=1 Tax=Maritimibacter alkaliphilus TaxID=404236 RepID=UPI001C93B421|nr:helix-turn-helix domain-containing protein [Maritimibacter alkaliphilus]MBY6092667.1 helix-turn-helix transcriptional regulator [Maritimibacter alkaliphilus]